MPVIGRVIRPSQMCPHTDTAIGMLAQTEIDFFAVAAFHIRKQPPRCLRIVPHVRASALTTADTFPRPEATILKPIGRGGRKDRGVGHSPVEKPVRQG